MSVSNQEENTDNNDDGLQDLGIPVPVQTYLWGQIAPFIRPKLGKLHEAACMFCQHAPGHYELKEACKSIEKVLVQNIHIGLSVPLTQALESVERWRVVQAALPHIMHCAAALLHNRVKDLQMLGPAETKLLYTLHWILLFASAECADEEVDAKNEARSHLFSIPTISLFVYLFAPIVHHLKESDFQNYRLENGIKLWHGMWEFSSPHGAPCFAAAVKPKARQLLNSLLSPRESLDAYCPNHSPKSLAIYEPSKHDEELQWVSSPKDSAFPETIPEEASSVEEERVVIFRIPYATCKPSFYTADASLLQQSQDNILSKLEGERFNFDKIQQFARSEGSSIDKDSDDGSRSSGPNRYDTVAATFLDVGVLRCLFILHWQEEGVYWCLHYIYNRLRKISEEVTVPMQQARRRSNSLPIPQIEISVYQGTNSNSRDSPSGNTLKDFIEVPEQVVASAAADCSDSSDSKGQRSEKGTGTIERRANSERKRNVKIASFKSLIESKIFSKSEKELERIGLDKKTPANDTTSCISQDETEFQLLGNTLQHDKKLLSRSASVISTKTVTNLVKGKSMPSLTCKYVENSSVIRGSQSSGPRTSFYSKNPIITVTEHTPVPSPEYMRRQGSYDSQLEIISQSGSQIGFRSHMLRSHTDSHIDYSGADESEAPGSAFYITREGSINYEIVLLAVYMVFKRESNVVSLRVLETGLNITEVLLDLGVIKTSEHAHHLVMGIIKRTWLHLGCPHGCNEGIRGPPAEFLRTQCQSILSRMLRQEASNTRQYLRKMIKTTQLHELVEFFHAFVGFCVDPSSLLSPLSHKRHSAFKTLNPDINNMANNYATNFGGGANGTEAQVIHAVFKSLVTRCVQSFKELKCQEHIALYSDVRQLITYIKNAHGGTFRRVALSGSIDVTPKKNKKAYDLQTTRVIRHIQHSDASSYQPDDSKRKLFFKKRSTSSACASLLETEGQEEQVCENQSPISNATRRTISNHPTLTPKHSERTFFPDTITRSERNSVGRLGGIVRWFRGSKDATADLESGVFGSNLAASILRHGSFKSRRGDGIGRSLQRVRRRVERRLGRIGLGKGKKVVGGVEEATGSCFSRRSSFDYGEGSKESEIVVLKERRLIPIKPVREGMQRFNFLLEVCVPGTVPDPQLIGAIMDLPNAPVVTRAALLLECAHYVQKANSNQWASWIKQNLTSFRPSGPNIGSRIPSASGIRRTHILQRAAGKMFYQWGEVIGMRLEEMLMREKQNHDKTDAQLNDPDKQNELVQQDEEEDFLDEASVNPDGNNCPPALRLIACLVLYEITAFLRETYQTLPKTSKMSTKEKPAPWEKIYREANRRWSMALSSMGHSQTSAQSLQSIAGGDNERKISFVLHEPDNESENSSNTTVTMQGEETNNAPVASSIQQRRPLANVRPFLLRRGTQAQAPAGGSFKRRSLKLRRGTKESKDLESDLRRTDSIQSRRKVSSISDRSDTSEPGGASGGEESPGILSDEPPPESPCDSNETDETGKTMPWTKSVLKMINSFHYYCSHQNYCHPYCYQRNIRASSRLIKAVRKVYGDQFGIEEPQQEFLPDSTKHTGRKDRKNRKVSDQNSSQTSLRHKENLAKVLGARVGDKPSEKKPEENSPVLKYIKNHVRELFHIPMAILIKSAVVLTEDSFIEVIPAAWELLLEKNPEISTSAAALYIIASVRAPSFASEIMQRALKHKDPDIRIQAILRYQVLWKSRFQVWPRMEEGAHVSFKVPPPGIEFTLPSPKIGIESLPVVDPPWCPRYQNKDMEVQLNQERHRSFVTATKTRKKQQAEAVHYAIKQQEDKQRAERESFLLTTIPITQQASHAPGLDHSGEDHNEAEDEAEIGRIPAHLHAAHSLFPSVLCSSVMQIVACLDDAAVNSEGVAVYGVAYQVIWQCLVEDSALFLRYVLERLTRDRQEQMFKLLRHLIRFVPRLPQQAAFALYNYIIGYVMFYVRSSHESSQKLVGAALSVLWMVVHSVHGIMFKDLKQILRKEQCDASILLTANVPSAKKIVVHGPDEEGGIPSQFPVQEETQFLQLLRESLDFFSIDEKMHSRHVLIDYKTQKILNPNWYVRDLYFFKRSQYPQLRLVEMPVDDAFDALQKQELVKKFVEIGKVHLTWAILKNVDMVVQRVVFLHEELMKLPFFPRKALESDLDLYQGGELGKELLGLDVLHKFMWVRLIARMFEAMAGNFAYSGDIHLFLNVLSGAAILHSEDACIMRYVMATFINAAFNFKNIFSTNGYFLIMPTLLQVYSFHQTNKLVTTTIEYAVKQFYLLNRKPFIMQMFGAVSAILDTDEEGVYGDASKVQSSCLFNLLLSLETPSPDPLNIAELIKEPTPLKAIDFCYHDEDEMVTVLDCITLCVMVVSYSAENSRGYQMLIILEAILPCYMQQIQLPTYIQSESKTEREILLQLAVAVRTMVHNSEGLAKSYNGPYRNSPEHKGSSQRNCSRGPPVSPGLDYEDESHSKYVSDVGRNKNYETPEDSEAIRTNFRRARDVLLSVVGEFISRASTRLTELAKKQSMNDSIKNVELLDVKCHIRLADIAHSLLKVSPYDPDTMACRGLQRYMQFILPRAEWANDALKAALVQILRRLDKVFLKISKKPSIRRNTDWEAAAGLLKGIHETIVRHPYVLHWQQIKTLFGTVQNLIVNEPGSTTEGVSSGAGNAVMTQNPPPFFCSTVVRLIALQLISPVQVHSLEHICGGSSEFATQEKAEGFLLHLLMPLCLKVCSGRGVSDVGLLRQSDISYLVASTLNAMSPLAGRTGQVGTAVNRTGGDLRAGSLTFTGSRDAKRPARISGSLYQAGFLSLRILCICFEQRLGQEWPRVVRVMRDLGRRNEAAPELWSFLEFVVTHRTPLYICLMPFILHKISQPPIGDHERHMQHLIRERMKGTPEPNSIKSRGALLLELARELRELKEELEERRYEKEPEPSKRELSQIPPPSEPPKHQQRPSLISLFTGGQHSTSHLSSLYHIDSRPVAALCTQLTQHTLHPPRNESLSSSSTATNKEAISEGHSSEAITINPNNAGNGSSTVLGGSSIGSISEATTVPHLTHSMSLQQQNSWKMQPPRLRFVSSVEFRHSSGETSTTPLSPESPAEYSSGENNRPSRLQRSKASSRKTFRSRRGRQPPAGQENVSHSSDQSEVTAKPIAVAADLSWDSVSQTSSTSGYRDNNSLQTGLLSPDSSLTYGIPHNMTRSLSQHSLLMLFETQDEEDTLI